MSITNLESPVKDIPEVDGALEEDSVVVLEQSLARRIETEESHENVEGLKASILEPSEEQSAISVEKQFLSLSLVKEDDRKDSRVSLGNSMMTSGINVSMLNEEITVDLESEIGKYFQEYSKQSNQKQEKGRWIQEATYKVKKQIKKGTLGINSKQQELSFGPKTHQTNGKMIELQNKKYSVLQELRSLEDQQIKLRLQQKSLTSRSKPKVKYQITESDRVKLMELIKVKKQFQQSLEKKSQQLLEGAKSRRKEEEELIKQKLSVQNQKKKENILQKLKELDLRHQEREDGLKQSVLRRKQKYAYKKLQEDWRTVEKLEQDQKIKKLKSLHERHKLNIEQIKNHQRKYSEVLEKRASSQSNIQIKKQSLPKRQKTHFDKIIEKQLFDSKENNYRKAIKMLEHQFRDKITQFQNKVDQDFKPKVDPSKIMVISIPRAYSSVSLTKEQRVQKGLQYLQKAKELKKSSSHTEVRIVPTVQPVGYSTYKNYLSEREYTKYSPVKKEFKKLLNPSEGDKSYESVVRAKHLAEGLGAMSKRKGDSQMLYSMKTKLHLLENIF